MGTNKKGPASRRGRNGFRSAMRDDVFGLQTLRPLFYLEFHLLSFV